MASLLLSVLAASLAAAPVALIWDVPTALAVAAGLSLLLWPLMALARQVMGWVMCVLGEALTRRRET